MPEAPRSRSDRTRDVLDRLTNDVDLWVATASADAPYLIPLSYLWDGTHLLIATPSASTTSKNLMITGKVRLGLGLTRDVVLIEGISESIAKADLPVEIGDAFAEKTGFDPRNLATSYTYFRIRPVRIQAWREANELDGRDVMRDGAWIV
jgi:hypothetical protein